jgi:N-acetylglutamate synthase-like GNAT family acetyltransferase
MKTGKRTSGPASCQVRYSALVDASVRGKLREVLSVHCPAESRKHGHAGRLLDSVCAEADASGVSLLVTVEPFDGDADVKALGAMYSKRGFRAIQEDPLVMLR